MAFQFGFGDDDTTDAGVSNGTVGKAVNGTSTSPSHQVPVKQHPIQDLVGKNPPCFSN